MSLPKYINNEIFNLSTSVGISVYPDDGEDFEQLLKSASIALQNSKDAGRNRASFYTDELNDSFKQELIVERELREAIKDETLGLQPFYQPKYSYHDDIPVLSGAEALIRWFHPDLGFIPPDSFIPIAEKTGQVTHITRFVLEETCRHLENWLAERLYHPAH